MKKIMLIFVLLAAPFFTASTSYAEITGITIDSVMRIGQPGIINPMMFEVCGRVMADEAVNVTITSDPNTKRYAPYTTKVDENGAYCQIIAGFTGRVLATATPVHGDKHGGVKSKIHHP